jgi:hypothetical protein
MKENASLMHTTNLGNEQMDYTEMYPGAEREGVYGEGSKGFGLVWNMWHIWIYVRSKGEKILEERSKN